MDLHIDTSEFEDILFIDQWGRGGWRSRWFGFRVSRRVTCLGILGSWRRTIPGEVCAIYPDCHIQVVVNHQCPVRRFGLENLVKTLACTESICDGTE